MLLTAIKSLDTAFTVVQECLLPNFLLDRGKCMPTVKSLYSPAPEYFSPVGCHKMAFCSQIKEQKSLSCLPLASEMYRHSMALNSSCRRRNKISYLKKFKFVFLRATIEHGRSVGGQPLTKSLRTLGWSLEPRFSTSLWCPATHGFGNYLKPLLMP